MSTPPQDILPNLLESMNDLMLLVTNAMDLMLTVLLHAVIDLEIVLLLMIAHIPQSHIPQSQIPVVVPR